MSAGDICYIILAHSDTPQLLRLLAALDPASPKFVHFDARYTGELPEIGRYGAEYVKPRLRCFWGGFSLMDATIGAAEFALARCDGRRFVLLSGACFPTKSPDQVLRFFEENRGAEFIDFFYLRDGGPKYQTKEQRYWVSEERFEVGPRTRFLAKALARS